MYTWVDTVSIYMSIHIMNLQKTAFIFGEKEKPTDACKRGKDL